MSEESKRREMMEHRGTENEVKKTPKKAKPKKQGRRRNQKGRRY